MNGRYVVLETVDSLLPLLTNATCCRWMHDLHDGGVRGVVESMPPTVFVVLVRM